MGDFSKQVGYGNIPGPSERKFDRDYWLSVAQASESDPDDRDLANLGCFFDELLSFIRRGIGLGNLGIEPKALVRWLIAHANAGLLEVHAKSGEAARLAAGERDLFINRLVQETDEVHGNRFSIDELLTGVGDGLKHPLRELGNKEPAPGDKTLGQMSLEEASAIHGELNTAIVYQVAVEIWLNCKGNGYRAAQTQEGLVISARDWPEEVARAVSAHRRLSSQLSEAMMFLDYWWFGVPAPVKRQSIGIQLVTKIHGLDRIAKIELGYNLTVARHAASTLGSKIRLQRSYFGRFMSEPLPKSDGLTLLEIIDAWRFVQSLAQQIFIEHSKRWGTEDLTRRLRLAPAIGRKLLTSTLARATFFDTELAGKLVDFFTFQGRNEQELWTQPLVSLGGEDITIVLPCIHSVQLERIIERWMRQGGIDLERRGMEFQQYCVQELTTAIEDSALREHLQLATREVVFQSGSATEKVDVVLILGSTVLLLEAKCVLWPDDSLQYASLRRTIVDAAAQVDRQSRAAEQDYEAFSSGLAKLGLKAPVNPNIIRAVVTNSAIYSGFDVDGVPITDLAILELFLENELIRYELRQGGRAKESHTIKFYDSPEDAAEKLEEYLLAPPQLDTAKEGVVTRRSVLPIDTDELGKIIFETLGVEIDEAKVRARYGSNNVS